MAIKKLVPMLYTTEMKRTVEFYVNIIGFAISNYKEGSGWASLQLDDAGIMLAHPVEQFRFDKPGFTGSFYLKVDNVDELWGKLKDKTKICYEIEDFEYGMREFAIYDNNGYLLQFGQEL